MSAEKLKGCRPLKQSIRSDSEGTVDHSAKTPGGGSKDPMPLKSVSAGNSHSLNKAPGPKVSGVKSGTAQPTVTLHGLTQFCKHFNCSRMQLHRWRKLVPFPKKWTRYFRYHSKLYEATQKEVDLWFVQVRNKQDRTWGIHEENVRYH